MVVPRALSPVWARGTRQVGGTLVAPVLHDPSVHGRNWFRDESGEPWFVLKDLCDVLGLGNTTWVAGRLDKSDLSTTKVIDGLGRSQGVLIVNESGHDRSVGIPIQSTRKHSFP